MSFFRKLSNVPPEAPPVRHKSTPTPSISSLIMPRMFRSNKAKSMADLNRKSSEVDFTDNPSFIQRQLELEDDEVSSSHQEPVVIVPDTPVYDWLKTNCLIKDFQRTRLLRNIKASASTWWNRGVVGAEMEQASRNVIFEWAKSIDSLCKCDDVIVDNHVPTSIWSLPEWAIDTFPTQKMFLSVQSHVERHFGMKLDSSITYSVAGILSSEEYISSSSVNIKQDDDGHWQNTPPPPFRDKKGNSEISVRMYVCIYSGKSTSDFLRFFGSRSLCSKENVATGAGALAIECPSWFTVLSWSDHQSQVQLNRKAYPDGEAASKEQSKEFYIIALDASKMRRQVLFSDVDLLECEQLVRKSHAAFQLYLGKIEDRRRMRLSCYEETRFANRSVCLEAKSSQDVNKLIDEGAATLVLPSPNTRDIKSFPKPVDDDDNGDEDDDDLEYNKLFQKVKIEKIRTRLNTGFVLGDGLADLDDDDENETDRQLNASDDDEDEVTGNEEAIATGNEETTAEPGNEEAIVTGNRETTTTGNKEAIVTGNEDTTTEPGNE